MAAACAHRWHRNTNYGGGVDDAASTGHGQRKLLSLAFLAASLLGAVALVRWLGIDWLWQGVPQGYGAGDLLIALIGTLMVRGCLQGARFAWATGRMATAHLAALILVLATAALTLLPANDVIYAYIEFRSGPGPSVARDVALLAAAIAVGLLLPPAVRLYGRKSSEKLGTAPPL